MSVNPRAAAGKITSARMHDRRRTEQTSPGKINHEGSHFIMVIDRIALLLAIIGGLNWGSIGLFRFDIVAWIFGGQTAVISRVIYALVGLSALWCISLLFRSRDEADEEA